MAWQHIPRRSAGASVKLAQHQPSDCEPAQRQRSDRSATSSTTALFTRSSRSTTIPSWRTQNAWQSAVHRCCISGSTPNLQRRADHKPHELEIIESCRTVVGLMWFPVPHQERRVSCDKFSICLSQQKFGSDGGRLDNAFVFTGQHSLQQGSTGPRSVIRMFTEPEKTLAHFSELSPEAGHSTPVQAP